MATRTKQPSLVKRDSSTGSYVATSRSYPQQLASPTASTGSIDLASIVAERIQRPLSVLLHFDASVLAEAAKQPDDLGVLQFLLSRPEVASIPRAVDPLAAARMRGMEKKRELLQAEGGSLSTAEVAEALQVTPQAITKRRKEERLIAVELGTKGFHYPAWQIDLPELDLVLRELRGRDEWEKINFFLNPNDNLGDKRPLDVLRRKQVPIDQVVAAARVYGEQGA